VILTLTGENTFAATQAERQLVDAFMAKHGANGIERVDSEELDIARLPDLLQGATLFAPVRLVVLKNVSANKALQEPLAAALANATDDTTVVIADPHLDKRTKLYKFLKTKKFQDFVAFDEPKLVAWVQQVAEERDATIDQPDAQYLVQRAGHDQWRLYFEIEKLASYQPQINKQTIDGLVEPSPEGTAFELLDAAFAGKPQRVTELLSALKNEEDPYRLFGLLASQVHALAVVAAAGSRSPDVVAKEAGLHPFVVRKTQATARRLGSERIKIIASDVAACDWRLKSTGADPWHLLGVTLQKIAQ
jgi:DNA polymerase-3 subunit delta